jgi:predicted O-methyltransferase YrrM
MSDATSERWAEVDRYLAELVVRPDPVLEEGNRDAAAAGLPPIQVSAAQGAFLGLLVKIAGARTVLEIGTLGGYSTTWLARALPPGGKVVSLELEAKHAEVARRNLERAGVSDRVEIRVGPALESLRQLPTDPLAPFDFVFIDADKLEYTDYLRGALGVARPGTVIVADNVVRQGSVIEPGHADARVGGIRRFLEEVARTPELEAVVVQMVGAKGYDGMAILRVREARTPGHPGATRPRK